MQASRNDLEALSKDQLVQRILELQSKIPATTAIAVDHPQQPPTPAQPPSSKPLTKRKQPKPTPPFHLSPTRHIALLITYSGWPYSGLALQPPLPTPLLGSSTPKPPTDPLPTVEGILLAALEKTHLIEQGKGWEGCGFSRCGRTDRGVSSSGQVVSLWVRSRRRVGDGGVPLGGDWAEARIQKSEEPEAPESESNQASNDQAAPVESSKTKKSTTPKPSAPPKPVEENPYPSLLNRVLPPTIRVLAWSPLPYPPAPSSPTVRPSLTPPSPPTSSDPNPSPVPPPRFDARFSTQSRHYHYHFSLRPLPPPHAPLDLDLMQQGADLLVGEWDFRNFCKVDGSKGIENHSRRVLSAKVHLIPGRDGDGEEALFELIGTAFLWHQVRHIIAILFLIGHALEPPSLVTSLLTTSVSHPSAPTAASIIASKPAYQMGAALPLQLYECTYAPRVVDWRWGGYDGPFEELAEEEKRRLGGEVGSLLRDMKSRAEVYRVKARHELSFYEKALAIHSSSLPLRPFEVDAAGNPLGNRTHTWTTGAGELQSTRKYVEVVRRERGEEPAEINRKWREGGGVRRKLRKEAREMAEDGGAGGDGQGDD